jgi:predicted lipoprotein with Yx(FWY)xxD motif
MNGRIHLGGASVRKIRLVMLVAVALTPAITSCGRTSNNGAGSLASAPVSSTHRTALITTKHAGKLGTVLAFGTKRLTVYLFEADKAGSSSCTRACLRVWPPVIGSPRARAGARSAELGTITRSDGRQQVTYKGHPLYLYVNDKDAGDTYGQGSTSFGAGWYAIDPSGHEVDRS